MTTLSQLCNTIACWLTDPEPQNPGWSPETWETFQFASLVHGVGPMLHGKLGETAWLDEQVKNWLAEQYVFNGQRLAKMHAELKAILSLFRLNNVKLMPLKGSIISARFYLEPALRPMADLDLLIRPEDFERSVALLAQLGYEQTVVHWKHTEFSRPDNRAVASRTGEHPDNPRGVELHLYCRETFGGPTIDLTDMMWDKAWTDTLLDVETVLPSLEALWLHLLVHATYHLWQGKLRLIHLVDLWLLTPHVSDPAGVLQTVDARYTYPALALSQRYFPPGLDKAILKAQAARLSASFCHWADSRDLVNTSYLNPKPPGLYFAKALRFTEGRPLEIVQSLRFSFLPSPQELALDHPRLANSKMSWLAYFLLPLDWIKRLVRNR
jgi:hypothetical protein